jgi:hypothetical protein
MSPVGPMDVPNMRLKGKASESSAPDDGDLMPSSLKSRSRSAGSYASACALILRSSSLLSELRESSLSRRACVPCRGERVAESQRRSDCSSQTQFPCVTGMRSGSTHGDCLVLTCKY